MGRTKQTVSEYADEYQKKCSKKWLPSSFRSQIKDIWDFSFHTIEDAAAEFNISEQMVKRNVEQQLYCDALEEIKELKEKINAGQTPCINSCSQSPAPINPSI
ncbi:hypothetical protein FACS189454_05610 [Planctomycetales bacterium]|nr:hypothetical protein FACS189454_05610 [Planctomycetales bacterium]